MEVRKDRLVPTPIRKAVFLVVDTETTGLDPLKDGVCEFAAIRLSLADGSMKSFQRLVNPALPIPPEASAIHHLTDLDVAGALKLEEVLATLRLKWDRFDGWAAHNAAFDFSFLPAEGRPVLCTLRLARKLLPELPKHGNQYLRYALKLEVPQAKGLAAHRAEADAWVTAALLKHLLDRLAVKRPDLDTVEAVVAWSKEPILLNTCRFGNKHRDTPWSHVPKDYLRWMLREVKNLDEDTRFTVEHWLQA